MKPYLLLCFVWLMACSQPAEKAEEPPLVTKDPTPYYLDSTSVAATIDTPLNNRDTSRAINSEPIHPNGFEDISRFEEKGLAGIWFLDPEGLSKLLGHVPTFINDSIIEPDMHDFPRLHIVSADKSQMATLYMHYGYGVNDVSEIAVRYLAPNRKFPKSPEKVATNGFVTSKGIKLGMTLSELLSKFGEPSEKGIVANYYRISYQERDGLYYGNYYFENEKLAFFEFGTIYP